MFARVSALHGTLHRTMVRSSCGTQQPPLSRTTSFCDGSSGYESTRSHLGPHYSDYNMPRSNSPVPKYNSLKPRRRKHKRSQFYSLRLCRRHENAHNRKYQVYAIPIYKCPHKSSSTSTLATIVTPDTPSLTNHPSIRSSQSDLANTEATTPPIPAPRRSRKSDPSKHTYQNVPLPVFPPKNASLPKTKTDSLYNYKEHYQQQHRQEMQQYSYPLPSNSSSQLTLPLTRSPYHSSIVSPLQNSFVHANNRPSTLPHHETVNHLSVVHPDEDQQNYTNHDARQSRRHVSRGNERGQKYRKHKRTDRKSKQRRSERACETSFHQVQELGIPETCKITYPHYYEDNIAECPTEYHRLNPASRQQIWERRSNRSQGESTYYADPAATADTKTRNKSKRLSSSSNLGDGRSPSAPTIMQYAELHFRDVGQEIDV